MYLRFSAFVSEKAVEGWHFSRYAPLIHTRGWPRVGIADYISVGPLSRRIGTDGKSDTGTGYR